MRHSSAAVLLLFSLGGCSGPVPGDQPRLIAGRSECARCGMSVDQQRFAGGWVAPDGRSVLFDDAGEFLASLNETPEQGAKAWVGDFETGQWVRANDAVFVKAPGLATPMASGIIAFASRAAAEAFVKSRAGASVMADPLARPKMRA